jgi:hypothetical protein
MIAVPTNASDTTTSCGRKRSPTIATKTHIAAIHIKALHQSIFDLHLHYPNNALHNIHIAANHSNNNAVTRQPAKSAEFLFFI